jgi:hypothetical protein
MCFSAEASFTVGAALLPAGGYCVHAAWRKGMALLPLALIPFAFSAQQLAEGFVWIGIRTADATLTRNASIVFLFFAIPFWPFWIPFSLACPERHRKTKVLLVVLSLLSLVWLWVVFPLLFDSDALLQTRQVNHSINYDIDALPAFQFMPRGVWKVLYLAAICIPFFVGRRGQSEWHHLAGAIAVAVFFLAAYLVFWYAFTSVWCFFAAVLSFYLCYVFRRLPVPAECRGLAGAPG